MTLTQLEDIAYRAQEMLHPAIGVTIALVSELHMAIIIVSPNGEVVYTFKE